jgi:hypothetical protein
MMSTEGTAQNSNADGWNLAKPAFSAGSYKPGETGWEANKDGSDTLNQAADNASMPMSDKNLSVSGDLLTRLEARAEVEGRTVDELAEEAVRRLLLRKDLRSFVTQNRNEAEANGLTESAVPRLTAEYRNETRGR